MYFGKKGMSALFKGMLSFFILLKQSSTFFPHQTRDKKTKLFINQREKRILNTTFKLPLFGGTTFKIIHRKWEWGRWKRFTFYIPRRNKSRMFQDPGSGSGWPRPTATRGAAFPTLPQAALIAESWTHSAVSPLAMLALGPAWPCDPAQASLLNLPSLT